VLVDRKLSKSADLPKRTYLTFEPQTPFYYVDKKIHKLVPLHTSKNNAFMHW